MLLRSADLLAVSLPGAKRRSNPFLAQRPAEGSGPYGRLPGILPFPAISRYTWRPTPPERRNSRLTDGCFNTIHFHIRFRYTKLSSFPKARAACATVMAASRE